MSAKFPGRMRTAIIISAGFLVLFAALFSACATAKKQYPDREKEPANGDFGKKKLFSLVVPSPQEAVYDGKAQRFIFYYDGDEEPELLFYPSREARAMNRDGSAAAPVQAGVYYVSVRCDNEEAYAEFRILKHPVKIKAMDVQETYYNGNPKRVQASSEPDLPLSYSYYPNPELRAEAIKIALENAVKGNYRPPPQSDFKGYRRVDRAPSEQGTYYVWIYFPGDINHEAASAMVEFTILPPRG